MALNGMSLILCGKKVVTNSSLTQRPKVYLRCLLVEEPKVPRVYFRDIVIRYKAFIVS